MAVACPITEIRMFGGSFAPPGWLLCDGRELPITGEYADLYDVIGTTYGGGADSFVLPDLRSVPTGAIAPLAAISFIIAVAGRAPIRARGPSA
ncbi:MAG: phage tail protein [Gemmatimonadota bacterium]